MALMTEPTTFSLDVEGRYLCNTWQEAMDSANSGVRSDARPFDIIILGGGTFGAAVAQHLFNQDTSRSHRILVLEAGPFVIAEHTQNLPMVGLDAGNATSIAALRAIGQDKIPQKEVWGLAWHASVLFPGLAYCVGGRSLYWGGGHPNFSAARCPPQEYRRIRGPRPSSAI